MTRDQVAEISFLRAEIDAYEEVASALREQLDAARADADRLAEANDFAFFVLTEGGNGEGHTVAAVIERLVSARDAHDAEVAKR